MPLESSKRRAIISHVRNSFFLDGVDDFAYRLPHPAYGKAIFLVVHRAIQSAFEVMRARTDISLVSLEEDDVTRILRGVLLNRFLDSEEVAGFNRESFSDVQRQFRCTSHDGAHLAKEPDMRFLLRDDSRQDVLQSEDGITCECKPVDDAHAPGTKYCGGGIRRFVAGEYAWAMPEALMIGYIRGDRSIAKTLIPAMRRGTQPTRLATRSEAAPIEAATDDREALHSSRHHRAFTWRGNHGPATEITVYHSWHQCE